MRPPRTDLKFLFDTQKKKHAFKKEKVPVLEIHIFLDIG